MRPERQDGMAVGREVKRSVLEVGTEDMMAMLDLVDDGGELAGTKSGWRRLIIRRNTCARY